MSDEQCSGILIPARKGLTLTESCRKNRGHIRGFLTSPRRAAWPDLPGDQTGPPKFRLWCSHVRGTNIPRISQVLSVPNLVDRSSIEDRLRRNAQSPNLICGILQRRSKGHPIVPKNRLGPPMSEIPILRQPRLTLLPYGRGSGGP